MNTVIVTYDIFYYSFFLRGNPLSENRFFLKNSIFQKPHILVALSVLFQNMYNLYMNDTYLGQFWRIYWKP